VEDDLNAAMPRKTGIFSRIYLLFRAFICFFCRVEEDLNGVMPRTSAELAKLPGVGRYTAAAVGRWNWHLFLRIFLLTSIIADSGCLYRIPDPNSSILDPGSKVKKIPDPDGIRTGM
jgi:hypothetical protein